MKELEKQEKILVKIFMTGGSVMYFLTSWVNAQRMFKEFRYFLKWKYTKPTEENYGKLVEESEHKRPPFVNWYFAREDGEMGGVIDFCLVAGLALDEVPLDKDEKSYSEAMIELAKVQSEMMRLAIRDMKKGEEWRRGEGT